jgi:hypothetical protein
VTPTQTLPLRAVAALFLERQHLDRPQGRILTPETLARFAEDVGGIQLDSINVLDRAHYLTAWSRFGPYDRAEFDRICYESRVLFEYWAHAACLVPASHLPWWRRAMLDYRTRHTGWSGWLRKNPKLLRAVEDAVRERGPLANADFGRREPGGAGGWWSWKPSTHALHYLWMTGKLLVHSRTHFQKRFDLAERLLPGMARLEPPATARFQRWHIERALHAMGAGTETDLRMYLSFPRVGSEARKKALRAMLKSGEVIEVGVEGDRARWVALARDLPALERAGRAGAPSRGTALLSPFDSFLWHRERARRLFGFDYRIEVYLPGHRRVHGYYSLPILHDGQLIGRLDAKNDRAERRLEVRSVHFEGWFAKGRSAPAAAWEALDRDRALAGLAGTLWSLATFVGAGRVKLERVAPSRLAGALRTALREPRDGAAPAHSRLARER